MDSYNENLNVSNTAADTGADHEAPDAAAVAKAEAAADAVRAVTVAQAGNVQHVATPPAGEQTITITLNGQICDVNACLELRTATRAAKSRAQASSSASAARLS